MNILTLLNKQNAKFVKRKKQLPIVEMIKSIFASLVTLIFMKTPKSTSNTFFDSIQESVYSKSLEILGSVMNILIDLLSTIV